MIVIATPSGSKRCTFTAEHRERILQMLPQIRERHHPLSNRRRDNEQYQNVRRKRQSVVGPHSCRPNDATTETDNVTLPGSVPIASIGPSLSVTDCCIARYMYGDMPP